MEQGLFIVIDAPDGSGKETQTKRLIQRLEQEGHNVKTIDFPQYKNNVYGKILDQCLHGGYGDFLKLPAKQASLLYMGDRMESTNQIQKWLNDGYTVIADRFVSSNQIHQGAKIADPSERKEFMDWLEIMEHEMLGIPKPNAVIFLDVSTEVALGLLNKRSKETQTEKDQAESNEEHLRLSRNVGLELVGMYDHWHSIQCCENNKMLSIEAIHEKVYTLYQELVN